MKNLIRKWLGIEYPEARFITAQVETRDVLDGSEMAFVGYRIDNGYMLRISGRGNNTMVVGAGVKLIYCTDEKDMAEKIIAHRAFDKIAGQQSVSYSAKVNKF